MHTAGIYEGGRRAFLRATDGNRLALPYELGKLRRRLSRFCKARGIAGGLILWWMRRMLIARIRARHDAMDRVF